MKARSIAAAAAVGLSALLGTGAFAQGGGGLVNVSINNVANDIARNLSVDVNRIPVTVQAPIAVAAAVCGVAVSVLGTVTPGAPPPSCTATTTNPALNTIVQRQLG